MVHAKYKKTVSGTSLFAFPLLLILILAVSPAASAQQNTILCGDITLYLNDDGSVEVYQYLEFSGEPPFSLNLSLLSEPIYLEVRGLDTDTIIPFQIKNNELSLTVVNDTSIMIYYVTTNLTKKESQYWTLKYQIPCETKLILANDIVPLSIMPSNPEPIVTNGTVAFKFPPGNVTVDYLVIPNIGGTSQIPGASQTSTSSGQATGGSVTNEKLLLFITVIVALILLYYLYRKFSKNPIRKKPDSNKGIQLRDELLDERDKAILKALEEGDKTASELIEITGIPKTPLYRRLRKLIDNGLVDYVDSGSSRKYRLRNKS